MLTLCQKRNLVFPNGVSVRTPILVPSFSSRVKEIGSIFEATKQFIDGPFLMSLFDVAKNHVQAPLDFATPVFLDSGGYEVSKQSDLSDVGDESTSASDWSFSEYQAAVRNWNSPVETVFISYDHPKRRHSIPEQVKTAAAVELPIGPYVRELLLKPETVNQSFLPMDAIGKSAGQMGLFAAIGVTEKEIGNSVFERMKNIARLRRKLHQVGIECPIHVFGSLDTVTTLFYFVAGADIFDGLTWLRYAYSGGRTLYRQDYGIVELNIDMKSPKVEALCWAKNYQYLGDMQQMMRRFLHKEDFTVFGSHADRIRNAIENLHEELEG